MSLFIDVSQNADWAAVRAPITHLCSKIGRQGRISLLREFTEGFSPTRVFLAEEVTPSGTQGVRLVFKTGAGSILRDEVIRYQRFIPHATAHATFVKMLKPEETLAALANDSSKCAIVYEFAASPLAQQNCVSLRSLVTDCLAGSADMQQVKQIAATVLTAVGSLYGSPKPEFIIALARYYLDRWAPDFRAKVDRLVRDQGRHLLTMQRLDPAHFVQELAQAQGPEAWHKAAEQPQVGGVDLVLQQLVSKWRSQKNISLHASFAEDLSLMVDLQALSQEDHRHLADSANLALWAPAGQSRHSFYEERLRTAFPGLDLHARAFRIGSLRVRNPLQYLSTPLLEAGAWEGQTTLVPAHGDLHPGNVLVVGTTPVLIDYGLAETELPRGIDAARLCGGLIRDVLPKYLSLQEVAMVVGELLQLSPAATSVPAGATQRALELLGTLFSESCRIGGAGFAKLWPLHLYGYSWIGLKWDDPAQEGPKTAHRASFILAALALTKILGDPGEEGPDIDGSGSEQPNARVTSPPPSTLETYLSKLRETAGQVTLAGDVTARPIQDVFVELEVTRGGAVNSLEGEEENDHEPSETQAERLALQTELHRRKSAAWRQLTDSIPGEDLLDFANRTLIVGAAGTGKSTLLRWLACEAAKRRELDPHARVPVWLPSLPPHRDLKEDLVGALTKRALDCVNLDNGPSEMAQTIRDAIASGRTLVLIDSLDESGLTEQEHAAEWLARLEGRVVLASRPSIEGMQVKDVVTVTLHGVPGIAAEQLLRRYFIGEDWVDGLLEELRILPDGQTWLETPVLLGLAATLYRSEKTLPRATLDLYRRALDHLLNAERLPLKHRGDALRGELRTFARDRLLPLKGPPRVVFDAIEIPYHRQELYRLTGLFEGGARLRFTHLTIGEYLAAEADIDLSTERTKLLAIHGQIAEGSALEVVPMAHALRGTTALHEALADARDRDLSDHRLLRLLLRALGYGGQGVNRFCSTHATQVIRLVAERLDAPSGRFGEAEMALMDAAERAFLTMRGLVDKAEVELAFKRLLRLPGDVGTEAHVATWILGVHAPQRRESNWWSTVERQARALVRANVGIDEILRLTNGVNRQIQWRAACRLAKYPELRARLRPLLYHHDALGRRHLIYPLAGDVNLEADWRERLSDEDEVTRSICVSALGERLKQQTIYLPRLRDMLVNDPSNSVRAELIDALTADPPSREMIRDILSTLISVPGTNPCKWGDFFELGGAAIRALVDDPDSEEWIRAFLCSPKHYFRESKDTFRTLVLVPQWRQVLLKKLDSADVEVQEIDALAETPEAEVILNRLLDCAREEIVCASIKALGARAEHGRLLQLLEHDSTLLRSAAIEALGEYHSHASLLRPFLTRSPTERIAAARALIRDTESLVSIHDNLLRYPQDDVRMAAVEVLSAHPIAFAMLREYFEETRSLPEVEWIEGSPGQMTCLGHGMVRGKILEALVCDRRHLRLVEFCLNDPHQNVREVAVRALASAVNDPSVLANLQRHFYSNNDVGSYEAFCELMSDHSFVKDHLISCLDADLYGLRFAAFRYLVDHKQDRQKLKEMLSSSTISDEWRSTIVGALMRDPTAVDLIRAHVDDESEYVRIQVLHLLRHDHRVREYFRERARNEEWMRTVANKSISPVRMYHEVRYVLASDPEAHPILVSYLDVHDEYILAFVASMLHDCQQARPRLAELLEHPSVIVRSAAMRALGPYEPARMAIMAALAPESPVDRGPDTDMIEVLDRSNALRVLRKAAADALKDVPELRTKFRTLIDNEDREVRASAIHSVSSDRSAESLLLLRERLVIEEDGDLRFQIIEALRGDPGSVEPLRERLHNDFRLTVRNAAARALKHGDLSPAYAVRELPSVVRVRCIFTEVVDPDLEALQAFLKAPRRVDLDAEPNLGEDVLAWCCARLTWASEIGREEEGQILGEVAHPVGRLTQQDGAILIRVAMDTFSLPYERFLRPNHNLMEVWEIARLLVASEPPSVVLACADVSFAHLQPPPMKTGEVRFGPTFFGFRVNRSGQTLRLEVADR